MILAPALPERDNSSGHFDINFRVLAPVSGAATTQYRPDNRGSEPGYSPDCQKLTIP